MHARSKHWDDRQCVDYLQLSLKKQPPIWVRGQRDLFETGTWPEVQLEFVKACEVIGGGLVFDTSSCPYVTTR